MDRIKRISRFAPAKPVGKSSFEPSDMGDLKAAMDKRKLFIQPGLDYLKDK